MLTTHNIGIQMKRTELTNTFLVISTCSKPFSLLVYNIRPFSASRVKLDQLSTTEPTHGQKLQSLTLTPRAVTAWQEQITFYSYANHKCLAVNALIHVHDARRPGPSR